MIRLTKAAALKIQAGHIEYYVAMHGEFVRDLVAAASTPDLLADGEHDVVTINHHIPRGRAIEHLIADHKAKGSRLVFDGYWLTPRGLSHAARLRRLAPGYLEPIAARMAAEEARDDSDSEIERTLRDTSMAPHLMIMALELRRRDLLAPKLAEFTAFLVEG